MVTRQGPGTGTFGPKRGPNGHVEVAIRPPGRPRSDVANRAILDAARDLLVEEGFTRLRLEHVAARAGVGKGTIYRRWPSKEALTLELVLDLAAPHLEITDAGDTRAELVAAVRNPLEAITGTPWGPVIRAMLSQIAGNPTIGDPFRASVVARRRAEVSHVIERGIARGDLRPDADASIATELLVGPVYFRLVFGGSLDAEFAERVADAVLRAFAVD
ncbi:MAG TPA: TetR/AcrR family transcriptional regulator [Candidatus Limnocylindrales bacterium]|nr:TetR/AcrR family transcriptional regulator [Candidatus Limnocylindrales bacterium]